MRILALAVLLAMGADVTAQAPPQTRPCSAPEHRQFDFWIGEWDVMTAGKTAGRMVLQSEPLPDAKGVPTVQRITWSPDEDGLRQHWESSADGGKTWTSVFDGRYVKRR